MLRIRRLVTEECYPWEGRVTDCLVPKKEKELTAPCPRSSQSSNQPTRTQLHRVGPVYRVATEQGIMHEIMTSGPVQGTLLLSNLRNRCTTQAASARTKKELRNRVAFFSFPLSVVFESRTFAFLTRTNLAVVLVKRFHNLSTGVSIQVSNKVSRVRLSIVVISP